MLYCKFCGYKPSKLEEEKNIDKHHIIPKYMGGTDKDGRIDLCKKCHSILHHKIESIIFNMFVDNQEECKRVMDSIVRKNIKF